MELPPEPSSIENYQLWRDQIDVWSKLTKTPAEKRGLALQFACRTDKKLCEAVLEIPAAEVECADGLKNVLNKLDKFHTVNKKDKAVRS